MIRPWYAFYPSDYADDTAHLSLTEHGAYRLLLDHYYMTAKPLKANAEQLLFICRAFATPDANALLSVLGQFFILKKDGYHHKRVDLELEKAKLLSEKRRNAGKLGGLSPKAIAKQMPSKCPQQLHLPSSTKKVRGKRAAAFVEATAPPVASPGWEAGTKWEALRAKLGETVWRNVFADCRLNGSELSLIAPTKSQADVLDSRYRTKIRLYVSDDVTIKTGDTP